MSSLTKNIATLAVGSLSAKIIGLAAIPIITRLYGPEAFGQLSVFSSLVLFIYPIITLRFCIAIPLARVESNSYILMWLSFILSVIMVVLLLLIFLVAGIFTDLESTANGMFRHWLLLTFAVLFAATYESFSMLASREKMFRLIAVSQFVQSLSGSLLKIFLYFTPLAAVGLVVGHTFQQISGVFLYIKTNYEKVYGSFKKLSLSKLIATFKRYKDYPLLKTPSHFLYAYAAQAPILYTALFKGDKEAGYLGLTLMALALPVTMITQNVSKAYYAEISVLGVKNSDKILVITHKIIKQMFLLGAIVGLVVFFLSPFAFVKAFGEDWAKSAEYAQALSLYLAMQFVASPLIMAFNTYRRQDMFFYVHLVRAIIVTAVFSTFFYTDLSLLQVLYAYSILLSSHYIYVTLSVRKVILRSLIK